MDPNELRQLMAAKFDEADALVDAASADKRQVTDEESKKLEALFKEAKKLSDDAKRMEAMLALRAEQPQRAAPVAPGPAPATIDEGEGRTQPQHHVTMQLPHATLRAFSPERASIPSLEAGRRAAHDYGMLIRAAFGQIAEDRGECTIGITARAREYCREHIQNVRPCMPGDEHRVLSGHTVGAGAFSVPDAFNSTMIEIVEEDGIARSWCNVVPMSTDHVWWPRRVSGTTGTWVGDQDAATDSTPAGNNVELVAKELVAVSRIPMSLLDDSAINLGDWVMREQGRTFAMEEDVALIDGDGASTYGGIVGIRTAMVDGTHTASYVDATAGDDEFDELLISDINKLVATLPEYGGTESWYISRPGYHDSIVRLRQALGGQTSTISSGPVPMEHLGYPVLTSRRMPKGLTTAYNETVMMFFGDMTQSTMFGERRARTVAQSDQRYFEYRQIGILSSERIDIQVHDLGDTSTAGPIVALRGNTS